MPIPVQSFATTPLGYLQAQMRNRIAMQMMRPLGAPGTTAPRPVVMTPQFSGVDPNQQAMQQQRAQQLQQQEALDAILSSRTR